MRLQGSQCSPGVSQCLGLRSQVALGSYRGPRISWQLDAGVSGWPWRSQIGSRGLSVQPLGSQGSPGVSQCLGMGAQEGPKVLGWLQVSYSGPGISGQLDIEVSMRLQGSQDSPGVSQCLGLGFQVALGSHNGLWGSQGSWTLRAQGGPRGLNAALGSRSVWLWGLMVPPGVLQWSWGSQGSWTLRTQ